MLRAAMSSSETTSVAFSGKRLFRQVLRRKMSDDQWFSGAGRLQLCARRVEREVVKAKFDNEQVSGPNDGASHDWASHALSLLVSASLVGARPTSVCHAVLPALAASREPPDAIQGSASVSWRT